jgi:hypothetical protein
MGCRRPLQPIFVISIPASQKLCYDPMVEGLRVEIFLWSFPARSFLPFFMGFMGLRVFFAICFPLV